MKDKNNKWVKAALIFFSLVCLWVLTYNLWSIHLDKEIERRFEQIEAEPIIISDVKLLDYDCSIADLTAELNLDTIVEVEVSYPEEESVQKQAYVVYGDTDVPLYADDKYGKIILPESWRTEE